MSTDDDAICSISGYRRLEGTWKDAEGKCPSDNLRKLKRHENRSRVFEMDEYLAD